MPKIRINGMPTAFFVNLVCMLDFNFIMNL